MEQTQVDNQQSFAEPKSTSPSKLPLIILAVLTLIFASTSVYFFAKLKKVSSPSTPNISVALPSPSPVATTDSTIEWQTYTNSKLNFSFQYPSNYHIVENTTNGQNDVGRIDFATDESTYLSVLTENITKYDLKNYCTNSTVFPCINNYTNLKDSSLISNVSLGGHSATSFYIKAGKVDDDYHIVITDNNPKIELRMYVSGGGLDKTFNQILSSFKFTDSIAKTSTITGFIKSINQDGSNYKLIFDEAKWINDPSQPNGYRIDNTSSQTSNFTITSTNIPPKVVLQTYTAASDGNYNYNEELTFEQFRLAFQTMPEKWTQTFFVIETSGEKITKITERYRP